MHAFGDGGGIYQISAANRTGDVGFEMFQRKEALASVGAGGVGVGGGSGGIGSGHCHRVLFFLLPLFYPFVALTTLIYHAASAAAVAASASAACFNWIEYSIQSSNQSSAMTSFVVCGHLRRNTEINYINLHIKLKLIVFKLIVFRVHFFWLPLLARSPFYSFNKLIK